MIYADSSFLFSFYAWDGNSEAAARTFEADARRPLFLTPWQHLETRNAVRRALYRIKRAKLPAPYQTGNVFKDMQQDLDAGRLRHVEVQWREVLRLVEELSADYTEQTGAAAGDLLHVAAAVLLEADTFWTFDEEQRETARRCGKFRKTPKLTS